MYLGDIPAGQTIDFEFTTVNTSGVPTTLSGTPAVSVYKSNSTTETTTGVTLTTDFDGRTGLNHLRIDTSNVFYAAGNDFRAVITTGTVGGNSVVGYRLAEFSIENRVTKVNVAKVNGDATAAQNLANAYNGTGYPDGISQSTSSNGFRLQAGFVATTNYYQDYWVIILGTGTGAGQAPRLITGNNTSGDCTLDANWITQPAANSPYVLIPAGAISRMSDTAIDGIFKRDLSAIVGEASRSLLNAVRFLRNKWSISGSTLTVTKEDDSTTAWTAAVTFNPSQTPVSSIDP